MGINPIKRKYSVTTASITTIVHSLESHLDWLNMKQVSTLYKTSNLLFIRPLELIDYENWKQANSNQFPPQNEWDETNWVESELTLQKFKALLKQESTNAKNDKTYQFGIFHQDDGLLLGTVALMDVSRGLFQNAYLGYRIFNPYWGQGFGTEACKLVLNIAFKELNLHRVEAGIAPNNKGSIKVAKKIGLKKEGLSPRRLFINDKWVDVAIYAATSEDYKLKYKFKK